MFEPKWSGGRKASSSDIYNTNIVKRLIFISFCPYPAKVHKVCHYVTFQEAQKPVIFFSSSTGNRPHTHTKKIRRSSLQAARLISALPYASKSRALNRIISACGFWRSGWPWVYSNERKIFDMKKNIFTKMRHFVACTSSSQTKQQSFMVIVFILPR